MVLGYLHMLVATTIVTSVLAGVRKAVPSYGARVLLVGSFGIFSTWWTQGANDIWFYYPLGYALFFAAYDVVGWLLAGLIIAVIVRPGPTATAEQAGSVP